MVDISILHVPISSIVTRGNAAVVAACLDTATPIPGTDFDLVFSEIYLVLNPSSLQQEINQLQPSQFNALQLSRKIRQLGSSQCSLLVLKNGIALATLNLNVGASGSMDMGTTSLKTSTP